MKALLTQLLRHYPALKGATSSREASHAPRSSERDAAPGVWAKARPGIPVPAGLVFRDIQVVPSTRRYHRGQLFDGGPVWPDFENTPLVRHRAHGKYVDINAVPVSDPAPLHLDSAIWGGRCAFHFGHLVAEHVSRLAGALYRDPHAQVLFTVPPGKTASDVPGYFHAVTHWLGLAPERIHFVTRPLVVSRLQVSAQAEHLGTDSPPAWYLDLLDQLPRLNNLQPIENKALYVHRMNEPARGNGAHAGETALVAALERAGVAILDPAKESLERQMAYYAGANLLIFAEGSAIHGRQLLGRQDQKILVLRRRPLRDMAKAQLSARCRHLEYGPVIKAFAQPIERDGMPYGARGLAFYNTGVLQAFLGRHGVDVAKHWRPKEYRAAAVRDARAWRRAVTARKDIDLGRTVESIRTAFAQSGFPELME